MWYSYQTCGGKDYWMTPEKKKELQSVPTKCNKTIDEKSLAGIHWPRRCPNPKPGKASYFR